jgi:hypothetical protein
MCDLWHAFRAAVDKMDCPYFAAADNFSALRATAKGVADALAANVAVRPWEARHRLDGVCVCFRTRARACTLAMVAQVMDEEKFRICLGSPIWSLMALLMIPLGLYLFLRPIQARQ